MSRITAHRLASSGFAEIERKQSNAYWHRYQTTVGRVTMYQLSARIAYQHATKARGKAERIYWQNAQREYADLAVVCLAILNKMAKPNG